MMILSLWEADFIFPELRKIVYVNHKGKNSLTVIEMKKKIV